MGHGLGEVSSDRQKPSEVVMRDRSGGIFCECIAPKTFLRGEDLWPGEM